MDIGINQVGESMILGTELVLEFTLYEMNTNSIIVYPRHEEWLDMKDGVAKYTVKGFAYTGGGRKIARVECTFDKGKGKGEKC